MSGKSQTIYPWASWGKPFESEPVVWFHDVFRPDGTPVSILVAALGPRMLEVAGRLADGTATWMTGRQTLAEHTVPGITRAAADAGRPLPRIVAALPVAITNDAEGAR